MVGLCVNGAGGYAGATGFLCGFPTSVKPEVARRPRPSFFFAILLMLLSPRDAGNRRSAPFPEFSHETF